jgi:hypothetical protein
MYRTVSVGLIALVISFPAMAEDWDDKAHKCYEEQFASLVAVPLERRMVRPDVPWEQFVGTLTCAFYFGMMTCAKIACQEDVRACDRVARLRRNISPLCRPLLSAWDRQP